MSNKNWVNLSEEDIKKLVACGTKEPEIINTMDERVALEKKEEFSITNEQLLAFIENQQQINLQLNNQIYDLRMALSALNGAFSILVQEILKGEKKDDQPK